MSNHTKIPIIRELGEQLSPTTVSVQPTARHRLHADDIPLEVEHGLAMTAAELLITDPDNAARKLLPSDLQRMAHVVAWALRRTADGVSAEPAESNLALRALQPIMGGVESVCEFCLAEAHHWLPGQSSHTLGASSVAAWLEGLGRATLLAPSVFPAANPPRPLEKLLLLEQRALQWAAADRAADDRAAELDRATERLGTSSGSGDIVAYVEAQARARVAGKVEDDTREWLLETARALLP